MRHCRTTLCVVLHDAERRATFRHGMTLLEVVIALALFFAAMAAISEILHMGSGASVKAQLLAEASLLGESKLNEVIAGIVPLTPVEQQLQCRKTDGEHGKAKAIELAAVDRA